MRNILFSAAVVIAAVVLLGFTNTQPAAQDKPKDIVDTAAGAKDFSTLVAAVKAAGLVDALKGKGPFTVFAPTDAAFKALPAGTVEALLKPENKGKLSNILTYHVISGSVMAADVKTMKAKTLFGQEASIEVKDGKVTIDGANVVTTDIKCSNGVIHVIDKVILPKTIVDVAASNDSFSTLVAAVKAAGLVDTLNGGPFTVFAPTNDAFGKLPKGTVEELLKPENVDKLKAILTYHVVSGTVSSSEVVKLKTAKTVNGKELKITVKDGNVMIDGAKVTTVDIPCLNGVVHIIDSVVIPAEK
jgi:uncharacterized surface protein with fasciclin (FAS1) repeats